MTALNAKKIAAHLSKIVDGDVFTDVLHRAAFSTDASIYQIVPQYVIAPCDASDAAAVIGFAAENNIPVVARGAGSGVAGESLGTGIILDMTRYMNRIIGIENNGEYVICEPGVVFDEVNDYLAKYGRKIGPDPSSGNRAVIGGCVANNATGAHSLEYGYIADHVESIEAILADGTLVNLENNFDPKKGGNEQLVHLAEKCLAVLSGKNEIINKALPRTKRNHSGYNIAGLCHDGKVDLARLMAGSESTLAVFTKIKLKTVPLPKVKVLLQLEFDSLEKMAKAVPLIVSTGASACELMDKTLIAMALDAMPQYRDILPADAEVVLLVEHTGDTSDVVREKIEKTDSLIGENACGRNIFFDAQQQKRLWKSRKDAVPLLSRNKGRKQPVPFIEDASVENVKLAEYIVGLKRISEKYNFPMSFYGHAGDGELHVRPYLDLGDAADVEKMLAIANDVFELVWSLGGSISGEHADGLVRAAFIKRQYGNEFYELLRAIKNIFDPDNLLNPGKIINTDADIMTKNLRAGHKLLAERLKTNLLFDENEYEYELEKCSGCGVCLSRANDLRMCPVFRALGEELSSSRAKANVLRFWATGQLDRKDFASEEFRKFLSLCVNCKACSIQCPSGVDISKLIIAAREKYASRRGLTLTQKLLSRNRLLSIFGTKFSPLSNFVMNLAVVKWLLEIFTGLDHRRKIPHFERGSFVKEARKYLADAGPIIKPTDKVAYFVDTYANYNDHELGFAVLNVLRYNNIHVIIPKQLPVPLPSIVYGDVKPAKKELAYNVSHLADAVRNGYKIICSEPSAALCLKNELRHFINSDDAKLISENTFELMSYLLDLYKKGKLKSPAKPVTGDFLYHNPCHLLAISNGKAATTELLSKLCNVKIIDLNAGCCGLAGTFGMQKKNYPLSEKISEKLTAALKESPVKNVLTECTVCKMQIEHISHKTTTHPIKILANCYNI